MKLLVKVLLISVVLAATSYGVYALVESVNEVRAEMQLETQLEQAIETQGTERIVVTGDEAVERLENFDINRLRQILARRGYYIDDIDIAIEKYLTASIMYNMTEEENSYIIGLFNRGYDFEKLIDIYVFLQHTNHGIELMREIYDIGAESGVNSWIENAYEKLAYEEGTALTLEDIMAYVDDGFTTEEILMAFELSLNGTMSTRDVLDSKLQGQAWSEIVIQAYACEELTPNVFAGAEDLRDINMVIMIAHQTGRKVIDIVYHADDVLSVRGEVREELFNITTEIENAINVVGTDDRETLLAEARKNINGLDDATIQEYLNSGMRIREIVEEVEPTRGEGRGRRR